MLFSMDFYKLRLEMSENDNFVSHLLTLKLSACWLKSIKT